MSKKFNKHWLSPQTSNRTTKKIGFWNMALMALFIIIAVALNGCQDAAKESAVYENTPLAGREGDIRIAAIRNLGADEHTAQYLEGIQSEATNLKFQVDTFTTDGDNAKFEDIFRQVLAGDYQGLIVSHGQDNAQGLIEEAKAKGIQVVTFDTAAQVDGVVTTAQDDASLAKESLEALIAAHPGKTPKVVKMWIDGFPPMVRRDAVYQSYLKAGKIEEVAVVGEVGDFSNVPGLNADAIGALLTRYQKGEIDAIWASWDAFATGAYTALTENDRREIQIFSIDVSNADLQLIQAENSPWRMTAAADAKLVGVINVRLLAHLLAGEETPQHYEVPATEILKADLLGDTTLSTLSQVYPSWGQADAFDADWLKSIKNAQ